MNGFLDSSPGTDHAGGGSVPSGSLAPARTFFVMFGLVILGILAGGVWFYRAHIRDLRREAYSELEAVAQLKVDQFTQWRTERLSDAAVFLESPFFAETAERWMKNPGPALTGEMLARFKSLERYYDYDDVMLADPGGVVRLSLAGHPLPLGETVMRAMAAAFRDRKPVMSDLHATPGGRDPHLDIIAPVFAGKGEGSAPLGAVILRIDPRLFLYPLIESWPIPSRSAETLLVRGEGDSVLFLNELRHTKGTALRLRIPLSRGEVPAVMAVKGGKGVFRGRDYRGIEVLSVLKAVPDSPWFMIAKVDTEEAFSVMRRESILILVLLVGLTAATVSAAGLLWNRNDKLRYRALFETEATLRRIEARHRITLMSVGDGVIAADAEGRVELLNPAAETLTGWNHDEALGRPVKEVFRIVNEKTRQPVESPVDRVLSEGVVVGLADHTVLIARDGSERPIADCGAPVREENGLVTGAVLVFRDETIPRATENVLSFLAQASAAPGGDFFRTLARYLAENLNMDYVCIDRLEGDLLTAHTVAVWHDGEFEDDVTYTLRDTPCGDVVGKAVCCFTSGVRDLFPRDAALQDMKAESYMGVTLFGHTGKPIGLIAVIGRRPLENTLEAESMLKLVAVRAGGELERQRAEEALRRSNRELQAISGCNQAVVRAMDEQALLDDVCRIICETAGYRMAWVGLAENDEAKTVRPVAWSGAEDGYLSRVHISWADTEHGRGPTGTAIRSGESQFFQDILSDPHAAPWREAALEHGYRSSVALPLPGENGRAFGALMIYSTEPNAFTADEIRMLGEMAGNLAFGVISLRNLAERQKAGEALRTSEERYRSLFDELPLSVMEQDFSEMKKEIVALRGKGISDFKGYFELHPEEFDRIYSLRKILDANNELIRFFQMGEKKDVPANLSRYHLKESQEVILKALIGLTEGEYFSSGEIPMLNPNGEVRHVIYHLSIPPGHRETLDRVLISFVDITDRIQLEEKVLRLQSEYERFIRHEVKNFFVPIKGYADLFSFASADHLSEKELTFLKALNRGVDDAIEFLDTMKKLQDIESGLYEPEAILLPVEDFVKQAVDNFTHFAGLCGVTVEFRESGQSPVTLLDHGLIPGVFSNLVKNAVEHVADCVDPRDKKVRVAVAAKDGEIVVTINNRGEPVPPERLATFFEKFNSDRTKKKGGTGLGTTYAQLVVQAHGGKIDVDSNADRGTTLTVTLPVRS